MRGVIEKRVGKRKTSYVVRISLGWNPQKGRYDAKKVTCNTRKEAEETLTKLLRELDTGTYVNPTKLSVAGYLDHWIEAYCKTNLAPRTLERYTQIIKQHIEPALGHIPLQKLLPNHILEFYAKSLAEGRVDNKTSLDRSLSPATVVYFHRVLREALHHAVDWGFIVANPADKVKPPTRKQNSMTACRLHVLEDGQVNLLLDTVRGTFMYLPVFLALTTGMRLGEILGLTWSCVDFERKFISVTQALQQRRKDTYSFKEPKTGTGRKIELFDRTVKELKTHKAEQNKLRLTVGDAWHNLNLVCTQGNGLPINPGTVSSKFHQLSARLELGVTFHDLRHTHATTLLKLGIPPKIVAERLGHSTTRLTEDIYSHVLPGMQREAARLLEEHFFGQS